MIDRINWIVWRRHVLERRLSGFSASYRSYVDSASKVSQYTKLHGPSKVHNSSLGRYTYVAGATIANSCVGSFCSIGPSALVGGLGIHPTRWLSTHPAFYSTNGQVNRSFVKENSFTEFKRVLIGNDVWIGARAIVLDGVQIGDGAIVAAGAVVSKNVEPYSIVGGIPAREVRRRFSQNHINTLLRIRWWDWDTELLQMSSELFRCDGEQGVERLEEFHRKTQNPT